MLTFRDRVKRIVPPWLRRFWASRIMYSFAIFFDLLVDAVTAGVHLRFPGYYSEETLAFIGRGRRIPRGPNESAASYALRLVTWLDAHGTRGGPYSMLQQLHAFWGGAFPMFILYPSGMRYSLATDGTITRDVVDWEIPETAKWARWFLFMNWPDDSVLDDGIWDDAGAWDDGGAWDSALTTDEIGEIRAVPELWNAAHGNGEIILLRSTDDPEDHWNDPTPLVAIAMR